MHDPHEPFFESFEEDIFPIQPGKPAPQFTMQGYLKGQMNTYTLNQYKGKWVVLFFYPLDFTFVCPTELIELNDRLKEFEALDVQVLGVSVDSVHSHQAWMKEMAEDGNEFDYPLLSDMTKATSFDYGVLIEDQGISLRGTFIIDPEGILRSYTVNDLAVGRNIEELLRLVSAFKTGELCPVGWKKGGKTLGKA